MHAAAERCHIGSKQQGAAVKRKRTRGSDGEAIEADSSSGESNPALSLRNMVFAATLHS